MTCIVGLVHDHSVYLAGDGSSYHIESASITPRADEKVFTNGPFVIGFTDSFRMGQLLRYQLSLPIQDPDEETYGFLVNRFIEAVRVCFQTGEYTRKENERIEGGLFMIGYRGQLYTVSGDFNVGQPVAPYEAIGCGADLALGAMHATADLDWPPEKRLHAALSAAEAFNGAVCRPFTIVRGGFPREVQQRLKDGGEQPS